MKGAMRLTEEQLRALQGPISAGAVKRSVNRYGAKYTVIDGIRFDSHLEGELYGIMKLRQKSGEVRFFLRQVPFHLEGDVIYRCDFFVVLSAGGIEVWDAKGIDTYASQIKRKQVKARYGIDVLLHRK